MNLTQEYVSLHSRARILYEATLAMMQTAERNNVCIDGQGKVLAALAELKATVGREFDKLPEGI